MKVDHDARQGARGVIHAMADREIPLYLLPA
jgi:hypothetical protein